MTNTQEYDVLCYLQKHPKMSAKMVALQCNLTLKNAAAICSRLHKRDILVADAIWCTVKPTQRRVVLHYSINTGYDVDANSGLQTVRSAVQYDLHQPC